MTMKTPEDIAAGWYDADAIFEQLEREPITRFTNTMEFAEWLNKQYRLAMAKGVQLGRTKDDRSIYDLLDELDDFAIWNGLTGLPLADEDARAEMMRIVRSWLDGRKKHA